MATAMAIATGGTEKYLPRILAGIYVRHHYGHDRHGLDEKRIAKAFVNARTGQALSGAGAWRSVGEAAGGLALSPLPHSGAIALGPPPGAGPVSIRPACSAAQQAAAVGST